MPPVPREGTGAMGSLQWALAWVVVLAVGLAPMPRLLGFRPVTGGATRRKKPIRPADTSLDTGRKGRAMAAAQPNTT
jgi:hypothetical protein